MCKVSVVVPVCNVEKYVGECVASVLEQTLEDIELICVDDASADESLNILKEYAKKDSRLKIIAYDTNKSASQARKDGALLAKGEYIMFLDGDDYLEKDACEKLYNIISAKKVDMVHFGTNIINVGNVPQTRIDNLEKLLAPYYKTLQGKDVFDNCFIEKNYRFSIWNKIYEAEYCKKAMEKVEDGFFPKAQDLYAFLILCYMAESYCGIEEKFYNYRFGAGITGNKKMTLKQMERFCHSVYVADAIQAFLKEYAEEKYSEIGAEIRKDLLNDCVQNWFRAIDDSEGKEGLDLLAKYWKEEEIAAILCEKFSDQKGKIVKKILGAKSLNSKNKEIKTIGIFYHRYVLGGVQRVISLLIPMYLEMGYKVVFFTDEIKEENEYVLPEGVVRIVLPHSLRIDKKDFIVRAREFKEAMLKYEIDVMCYQAASSERLLFDLILVKLLGIPFVLTVHEVAFQSMLSMDFRIVDKAAIYKLVDRVISLSSIEKKYWRHLGVNATYIPNPIAEEIIERDPSKIEKNKIVWIGRLDSKTKRCTDIVEIMGHVVAELPDAQVLVVGDEFTKGLAEQVQKQIEAQGLEENVILCGGTTDVDQYYRKAEIHLLTSVTETFPMTIVESKSYGLPLVMYELPFVEMCKDSRGILSAPQGDAQMMAKHIVSILKNSELKEKMQKEAHQSLEEFMEFDLKGAWQNVFDNLDKREVDESKIDKDFSILLNSLLQHYEYGVKINDTQKKSLRKKADSVKKSKTYKVGSAILFVPKKAYKALKKIREN